MDISGNWRRDGAGTLQVTASHVFETLEGAFERPARYGGLLSVDAQSAVRASVRSSRPTSASRTDAYRRLSYEKLAGHLNYWGGLFAVDVRLDQAPGIWMTAKGSVPRGLFDQSLPEQPLDVAITFSPMTSASSKGSRMW